MVVLAGWVLSSHTDELSGLDQVLRRLDWWWVVAAAGAEFLSFVSFARLQAGLLRAGLRLGLSPQRIDIRALSHIVSVRAGSQAQVSISLQADRVVGSPASVR